MLRRKRPHRRLALAASLVLAGFAPAAGPAAAAVRRPVPNVVIYPGDIIREQMLSDVDFPDATASRVYITNRDMLVGKVAKRTLLPGSPIATGSVGIPRIVSIGSMVRLVFIEDGLEISTYASALQSGAAGDVVSVRNLESGVTITGVVRPDGTIHVGPG